MNNNHHSQKDLHIILMQQSLSHSDTLTPSLLTAAAAAASIGDNNKNATKNTSDAVNKRKISHSAIEKRRRERINIKIMQLKSLVPECQKQENVHKLDILQGAIDYIVSLEQKMIVLKQGVVPHHQHYQVVEPQYTIVPPETPNEIITYNNHSIYDEQIPGRITPNLSPPPPHSYVEDYTYPVPHHRKTSPAKRARHTRPSPLLQQSASVSKARTASPLAHAHYVNKQRLNPGDSTSTSIKSESTNHFFPSPPSTHDSPPPLMARDDGEDPLRLLSDAAAKLSAVMARDNNSYYNAQDQGNVNSIPS